MRFSKNDIKCIVPLVITMAVGIVAINKPLPEVKAECPRYVEKVEIETVILEPILADMEREISRKAEEQNQAVLEQIESLHETTEEETTEEWHPLPVNMNADLQYRIKELCDRYDFNWIFFMGWMYAESHCEWKIGSSNDTGYMQIIPQFHQASAEELGIDIYSDLGNCEYALVLITRYMEATNGNLTQALQIYNTGTMEGSVYAEWVYENVEYIGGMYGEGTEGYQH